MLHVLPIGHTTLGHDEDKFFLSFFLSFLSFFRWSYSPLWALACWTIPLHFSLPITNSLHLLTPSTWRSLSTSSLHPFLGLPLHLVPSSSWVKIFLGILSSSILSRWPSQLILCPFILCEEDKLTIKNAAEATVLHLVLPVVWHTANSKLWLVTSADCCVATLGKAKVRPLLLMHLFVSVVHASG